MSARSEIFPDPSAGSEPAVRHLAQVVTIDTGTGREPAHLDLVALANVIVRSEGQCTELAVALSEAVNEFAALMRRIEVLERRDARMMDLIRSIIGTADEDDEYDG